MYYFKDVKLGGSEKKLEVNINKIGCIKLKALKKLKKKDS